MAYNGDRYKKGELPPFISFGSAITFAEKIYEHGGSKASYDMLSRIFDNSIKSSSFTKKLAALRLYGLVVEPAKGDVQLSEIGMSIAAPQSPQAEATARKEAFLRIEPFAKIYDRHKGKLLPADEFLKNILGQDCGIPKDLSDAWLHAFKEAIRVAGLLYERPDQKTQIMESGAPLRAPSIPSPATEPTRSVETKTIDVSQPIENNSASGMNHRIKLSNGRLAVFSIPDDLNAEDVKRVKKVLEGFKSWIDSLETNQV
ncbi:MAG TPA: hypothetical protein VFQ43_10025 [Nitrososphaera sp.]|nr:hypothetical protein [Nitrososphaera sp.]